MRWPLYKIVTGTTACLLGATVMIGYAQEAETETEPAEAEVAPKLLVLVPEKIDVEWFWYYYTAETQHLVQSAIEKALVRAGYDVVDVTAADSFRGEGAVDRLTAQSEAVRLARELGATHVVSGSATAIMSSHGEAYGVNVYRAAADASVKIIHVSDGKILAVLDAEATEGAQSQRAAGQEALKTVGKTLSKKVAGRLPSLI